MVGLQAHGTERLRRRIVVGRTQGAQEWTHNEHEAEPDLRRGGEIMQLGGHSGNPLRRNKHWERAPSP
jgi:hypothetical protein